MANSVNAVTLLGRIGSDVESKVLGNGTAMVKFSLATSEGYKQKDGTYKDEVEWHNIIAWGKSAEFIDRQNLGKGDSVYVVGKIKTNKWTAEDGTPKEKKDININQLVALNKKSAPKQDGDSKATAPSTPPATKQDESDDLPF